MVRVIDKGAQKCKPEARHLLLLYFIQQLKYCGLPTRVFLEKSTFCAFQHKAILKTTF